MYLSPEPIFTWSLDEGTGSVAHDGTGNARHGAISGASWEVGVSGGGLGFAGPDATSYVSLPDADALTPSAATIDVWVKPARLDIESQMIVHKYENNAPGNSDYLLYFVYDSLGFGTRGDSTLRTTLVAGQWYHIIAVANGADSRLYVNGELKASGALASIPNGNRPFVLGSCIASCAPNNRSFAGVIDEVTLWRGVKVP